MARSTVTPFVQIAFRMRETCHGGEVVAMVVAPLDPYFSNDHPKGRPSDTFENFERIAFSSGVDLTPGPVELDQMAASLLEIVAIVETRPQDRSVVD